MISTRTWLTSLVIVSAYVCSTEAKTEVKVRHIEDGGADCGCVKVKDVVCGTDNVTYMNNCVLMDCEAKRKPGLLIQYRGACKLANSIRRKKRTLKFHRPLHAIKSLLHTRHQPSIAKLVSPRKLKKVVGHVRKRMGRQQQIRRSRQRQLWHKLKVK